MSPGHLKSVEKVRENPDFYQVCSSQAALEALSSIGENHMWFKALKKTKRKGERQLKKKHFVTIQKFTFLHL